MLELAIVGDEVIRTARGERPPTPKLPRSADEQMVGKQELEPPGGDLEHITPA